MRTKKVVHDLFALLPEQKEQVCEWMLSGLSFEKVRKLAEKEFAIRIRTNESMESFWKNYCGPVLRERRGRAAELAQEVVVEAAKSEVGFEKAALDILKQKTFELMLSPQVDVKLLRQVVSFVLKLRDQDMNRRRLDLMERKIERAEEAEKTFRDATLSPEQREARMREIFAI